MKVVKNEDLLLERVIQCERRSRRRPTGYTSVSNHDIPKQIEILRIGRAGCGSGEADNKEVIGQDTKNK